MNRSFKLCILLSLLASAWGYNPPTVPVFLSFIPNVPNGKCPNSTPAFYTTSGGWCSFASIGLQHLNGVMYRVSASTVDTGDSNGNILDMSNWAGADAAISNFALYASNGNTLTGCSNTAGVTTCTFPASSPFPPPPDGAVCISGESVAAYNACFSLTGVTYTGAGCATQTAPCNISSLTFNQGGSPASGSGGNIVLACGLSGTPQLCKIAIIVQHHRGGASKNMPDYPFSQSWADSSAQPWQASTRYEFHQSATVGSHCYYVTNPTDTSGGGVSSATNPNNFSTSAGTSVDNTITWQDNGLHCLPQESIVGAGYAGGGNAPTHYAGGGAIYNINSSTGAGTAQCAATCVPDDVGLGFPVFPETPYLTWINAFNAIPQDTFGNPSAIYHYAQVPWVSQIDYIRFGGMDNGEWNKFLATVDMNASAGIAEVNNGVSTAWVTGGMTYPQFQGEYLDSYAHSFYQAVAAAYTALSPPFKIDTGTNCFAGGNGLGLCKEYSQDIVVNAKAASPIYGFGNQGWWTQDPGVNAANSCGSAVTGCEYATFDLWRSNDQLVGSIRHLQLQAPTCPINGNQGHCTNPTEGSLASFAQLAPQHGVNRIEWFATELLCTYDSRYTYANGVASGCEYADMQADNYQYFINNLAKGLPSVTSGLSGTSHISGTGLQQ